MTPLYSRSSKISFSESLALKLVSLLLALILWITILGLKREEAEQLVKFEPLVAPGMMITSKVPKHIQFTLNGPRILLKDVERKLQPIRPDLRRNRETVIPIAISGDLIGELPLGVKVTSFSPTLISIQLEEVVEKFITVKPTLRGLPKEGHTITRIQVVPSKVGISGPRSLIEELDYVGTEVFSIEELTGSKEGLVAVEVDRARGFRLSRDRLVRVRVVTRRARK